MVKLEVQPLWLVRLTQIVTVAMMLASYVLVVIAIETVPRYDAVTDELPAAPVYDSVWSAYWWLQLPLLSMAIFCLARRQVPLGVGAVLVLLLGGLFVIGWAWPFPNR